MSMEIKENDLDLIVGGKKVTNSYQFLYDEIHCPQCNARHSLEFTNDIEGVANYEFYKCKDCGEYFMHSLLNSFEWHMINVK